MCLFADCIWDSSSQLKACHVSLRVIFTAVRWRFEEGSQQIHWALRRMQQLDKLERLPDSQHCPKTRTRVFSSLMKVHTHVLWFPTRFSFYQIPEQKLSGINASVLKSWKLLPRIHSCDFYFSSLLKENEEQGTDIYWTPTVVKFFLWLRTLTALGGRWGTKTETGPMWLVPCH